MEGSTTLVSLKFKDRLAEVQEVALSTTLVERANRDPLAPKLRLLDSGYELDFSSIFSAEIFERFVEVVRGGKEISDPNAKVSVALLGVLCSWLADPRRAVAQGFCRRSDWHLRDPILGDWILRLADHVAKFGGGHF